MPKKRELSGLQSLRTAIAAANSVQCPPEGILRLIQQNNPPVPELADIQEVLDRAARAATEESWKGWDKQVAKETWFGVAKWTAWRNHPELCAKICGNRPSGTPTKKEKENLVWLTGGGENAPGLDAILKNAVSRWPDSLLDASLWKETNRETEQNRREAMQMYHSDYHPGRAKWGKYLAAKMKEAGISLARPTKPIPKPSSNQTAQIRILGESHSLPETGDFLIREINQAVKDGFTRISVEEPIDGSWKQLMGFLMQLPKNSSDQETLESAHHFTAERQTANRVSALACARNHGLMISFVDIPAEEKKRRYQLESHNRRRRIAYGEKFDPEKPESAEGGIRACAANLLSSYHNARRRSRSMANNILALHASDPSAKILHIGGSLHTLDIAHEINLRSGGKILTETRFGPLPDHPLMHAFGKTPKSEKPEKTEPAGKTRRARREEPSMPEP